MSDISLAVRDGARRMTYAELAEAKGISVQAARRLTLRHRWAKQPGNNGLVRVSVPLSSLARTKMPRLAVTLGLSLRRSYAAQRQTLCQTQCQTLRGPLRHSKVPSTDCEISSIASATGPTASRNSLPLLKPSLSRRASRPPGCAAGLSRLAPSRRPKSPRPRWPGYCGCWGTPDDRPRRRRGRDRHLVRHRHDPCRHLEPPMTESLGHARRALALRDVRRRDLGCRAQRVTLSPAWRRVLRALGHTKAEGKGGACQAETDCRAASRVAHRSAARDRRCRN